MPSDAHFDNAHLAMRLRSKIVGLLILGGGLLIGGLLATRSPKTTEVTIEPVIARNLVASVTASGQVRPHTKVDISLDITGRITRLAVKEGDMVQQGQFLLQIDPSSYQAQAERAQAVLASNRAQAAQAHANLLQAQDTYNRTATLKHRNPLLVSDEQIEQLVTAVKVDQALWESAQNDIAQGEASLRDAQSVLAKTTVVAPITGQVTRLNVEQGETAIIGTLNKDAATLLTISDMRMLETRVQVDETDVSRIKVGDSAVVQLDAFPDTTIRGVVTEISNSSSTNAAMSEGTSGDKAVDYAVTVHFLNAPHNTRPDFSATAKIITATRSHVLAIPIVALTVRDEGSTTTSDTVPHGGTPPAKSVGQKEIEGVFVVGANDKVTFCPVRVGIAGERYFEVLSGLRSGERIVGGTYQAIRSLKDGMQVHPTHDAVPADSAGP
ncbi:MAG TPA: efflux RND transporter periplasmic adaptor subunit [Gemmatimonadaceae bacterium]|nr:efflux RND transporter periplasmic adaptor subunit [Gemmatimonadaceae bacterium]